MEGGGTERREAQEALQDDSSNFSPRDLYEQFADWSIKIKIKIKQNI